MRINAGIARHLPILGVALAGLLGLLAMAWSGLLAPADHALWNLRFKAADRAPSGETVFVEIDAESLSEIGMWPWPRQLHADMLDRLMGLGAAEVVFDIDFSTTSNEQDDAAFEQSLEQAGGYALLAAFQQIGSAGTVVLNSPIDRFAAHSESVLVNVDGDGTRLLRSVPAGLAEPQIRSLALALVPEAPLASSTIVIDYGIDLTAIPRVSAIDLLRGNLDPAVFANKQVVIGASAIELRDFFRVPRFGVIPGPLVQLAAAETLKTGRPLVNLGAAPAMGLALLSAALFALLRGRLSLVQLAWIALAASLLVELGAWLALRDGRLAVDTAVLHFALAFLLLTALLHDRARYWREIFRQQARLAYLASHDEVTGAMSRQAMLDDFDLRLTAGSATVILVQLGRMDIAVAALGHDVGDSVARQVAERLERQLGHKAARIASDVFAWIHPERLDTDQQLALCRWVSSWLDTSYPVGAHRVILDTRFGTTAGGDDTRATELLRQAEVALTQARSASIKIVPFAQEQGERVTQRRLKDIALRQALENGEFFLLYQPQIDLTTSEVIGVEALVRWHSESLGAVSPADFIPLAEETGLIVKLGEWILLSACTQAAQWNWRGRLAVNVSATQFRMSDMLATVQSVLDQSGFPANRLDLELTESLFMADDPAILATLQTLRRMGIGIAIDDFGTGYSSLSYLSRLPVDKLKIDQSFIRPLPDPQNAAIVETIVLMARRLGKDLVAEGIETIHQRDYLADLGCQVGQGYLFGRPALPEALGFEQAVAVA